MRRDDLMKPDLLCKVLLLCSGLTIGVAVLVILAAAMRGTVLQ